MLSALIAFQFYVEYAYYLLFIITAAFSFFFYVKRRKIGHVFCGIGFLIIGVVFFINQYLFWFYRGNFLGFFNISLMIDTAIIISLLVSAIFILTGTILLYRENKQI